MNRRTALATTGIAFCTPLVGCLEADRSPGGNGSEEDDGTENGSESSGETGEYEECHLVSISDEWLPEEIRNEVEAALEEGQYETETLRLAEAIDPDRSYLVIGDTPYDPVVETDGEVLTLELGEVDTVRWPEPRRIAVSNADERTHEVHIELRDDEEVLVDETLALESGEQRELEATAEFGSYELRAEMLTGYEGTDEFDFSVGDSYGDATVDVGDDEVFVTQSVADPEPCPWDTRWE